MLDLYKSASDKTKTESVCKAMTVVSLGSILAAYLPNTLVIQPSLYRA